jgi:glycosyltransferase involved in cell wall biosynthesis
MGEYLREKAPLPRVLAMQISQTLNYKRMIENIRLLHFQLVYRIEYRRVRRYEPRVMHDYDSCLLISEHDKRSLDNHEAIKNVFYSPHGVDVEYYKQNGDPPRENALLFTGFMGTPTNIDAALFFYSEIYPLIKRSVPDIKLYLVGMHPAACIRRIAARDPSVVVTGFVKDLRPYYAKAKVAVDPLRIGAGLQNKILVAMCMELPMVCTSVANEGIAATDGEHLVIADDPQRFAEAVVTLLKDRDEASRIARQGRKLVEERWTWEYYFEQLEQHFRELTRKA